MNILNVKKLNSPIDGKLSSYLVTTNNNKIQLTVPIAEDNTDYQAILKWVAEGNTIEEADD
tara:strand:+ start:1585 stop:1767 length:183 start_codon:yes stop_codon:yes gene_type:complete